MSGLGATPLSDMLTSVGAKTPAPGGGAVAATVGALAAALGEMVLRYSIGRRAGQEHDTAHERAVGALEKARTLLLELAEEDEAAYENLSGVLKLARDDPQRVERMPGAVEQAIRVPQAVLATAANIMRTLESVTGTSNRYLRSDLAISAVLAEATVRSSVWNVRINLTLLTDDAQRSRLQDECARAVENAATRCASIEQACCA